MRRAVLEAAGIPVEVVPADIDERALEREASNSAPGEIAMFLARQKALAVASRLPGRIVLGADQTLALGTWRFSKPTDMAAAREHLLALCGKTHELHSGLAVVRDREVLYRDVAVARLSMRNFSDEFLKRYLAAAGNAVTASVGGYQLEGIGIHLFERVDGDHFTILGMPLLVLLEFLRKNGFVA